MATRHVPREPAESVLTEVGHPPEKQEPLGSYGG
jgi:hypothetical protein